MNSRTLRIFLLASVLIPLCGFSSCSKSLDQVCANDFPAFEQALSQATAQLGDFAPKRTLASVGQKAPVLDLSTKEQWRGWAERTLKQTQYFMDAAEAAPNFSQELKTQLNGIANELVSFHGYTGMGEADMMIQSLSKIRVRTDKVKALACSKRQLASRH